MSQLQPKHGFLRRHCEVCGREQWHYQFVWQREGLPVCREHSVWPPVVKASSTPTDAIIQMGSLRKRYKMPPLRRDRMPVRHLAPEYTFDEQGNNVMIPCGRCGRPAHVWGIQRVRVFRRWLFLERPILAVQPDGRVKDVRALTCPEQVNGCALCVQAFEIMQQL